VSKTLSQAIDGDQPKTHRQVDKLQPWFLSSMSDGKDQEAVVEDYCGEVTLAPMQPSWQTHHRLDRGHGHFELHSSNLAPSSAAPSNIHAPSMAADATEDEPRTPAHDQSHLEKVASNGKESVEQDSDDDDDEEDDVDEEPKLKYSRLTSSLLPVYRNGDATSSFMVAGDKMVWKSSWICHTS
jgi:hypothetical protein